MANKKSQIIFDVELDENNVPEKMEWNSTENQEGGECNAAFMSIWDTEQKNTLKIDLWTKEMTTDDMKILYHQTFLTMSDALERSTGEGKMAHQIREFARYFGEEMGIIERS